MGETPEEYDALCTYAGDREREADQRRAEAEGLRSDARAMAARLGELRDEVIASHAQIFELQERSRADAYAIWVQARLIEALTGEGR